MEKSMEIVKLPIDLEIIEKALQNGILKKDASGFYKKVGGFLSLTYIEQIKQFVITFGINAADAGYVLVSDFEKTWDIVK